MIVALVLIGVCIVSMGGTALVRRYARAHGLLDIPNERSSHCMPTPRGGGSAIVVATCVGWMVLAALRVVDNRTVVTLITAGAIVAVVGLADDHRSLGVRWRLLAHFTAASWGVWRLGGMPELRFETHLINLGFAGDVLVVVALVWLLNLYNFMDGIDGIAGVETVTACVGATILSVADASRSTEWTLPAVLGVATIGFLVHNYPPASIFMGDVGSGYLGIVLGMMALSGAHISTKWFWSWAILLAVFIVDATVTLAMRARQRRKLYEAHRTHAYQLAADKTGSHRTVVLAVIIINTFWLTPLAIAVGMGKLNGALGTLVAYSPLVWTAYWLRAPTRL